MSQCEVGEHPTTEVRKRCYKCGALLCRYHAWHIAANTWECKPQCRKAPGAIESS